jgi:AcrR family transcriptional regulator
MPRVKTADKERAILEAASRVFAVKEFHEVLTDEIAAGAGIGKGTIYRYFDTKEELYLATIAHGLEALHCVLAASFDEPSPSRRLARMARAILGFSWHKRDLYTLLARDDRRFQRAQTTVKKHRERIVALVERTIAEGARLGELRALEPRVAAELFLGMMRAANCHRNESDTLEACVGDVVSLFLHGAAREERA